MKSLDLFAISNIQYTSAITQKENSHVYSRMSSPTRSRAEEVLSSIASCQKSDSSAHAVLYSSGNLLALRVKLIRFLTKFLQASLLFSLLLSILHLVETCIHD